MILEYPNKVRYLLSWCGFNVEASRSSVRGKTLVTLSVFLLIETINSMINNWNNLIKRFRSIEHLCIVLAITGVMSSYVIKPTFTRKMLDLAEEQYQTYYGLSNMLREKLVNNTIENINLGSRILLWIFIVQFMTLVGQPIMYMTYLAIASNQAKNESFEFQDLPLPLSYGHQNTSLLSYTLVFTIQIVYICSLVAFGYCAYATIMFATRRVTSEAKLFTIMLNYLDHQLNICRFEPISSYINLKDTFKQFIVHHNTIYRKCKAINENLNILTTIANNAIALTICVSLYSLVKVNNPLWRVKCVAQILVCVLLLYIYSLNGQELINESDDMYQAMMDFTWYDKPDWFKKRFLIMLTRAQTKLEVKPFGLYVVDLRNFSLVMNAAYSYFNVFNRIS